jgi:hypothetical protein
MDQTLKQKLQELYEGERIKSRWFRLFFLLPSANFKPCGDILNIPGEGLSQQ